MQDKSLLLVQVLNIQKSSSVVSIIPTLFWYYIKVLPDWSYLDVHLKSFLHFRSLINLLGNKKVFVSVFPSIRHLSAINDVMQARLNAVVEIIVYFLLLGACLNIVTKIPAEGTLTTIIEKFGID